MKYFLHKSCNFLNYIRYNSCKFYSKKQHKLQLNNSELKNNSIHLKLLKNNSEKMTNKNIEELLAPYREKVQEQGNLVRKLKQEGAPEIDIKKAVTELKLRKKILEDMELENLSKEQTFDRVKMEDLIKRRFFYDQSFAIYGGITGQYDFGPMGCALKSNIINLWRNFFVIEEQLLEVDCSILTPEPVLKASGHVERFADFMVKDLKTGECFRLDHLIKNQLQKLMADKTMKIDKSECEDIITKLDGMTKDEMNTILKKFNMKSPSTGNDLSEPMDFNLMFSTEIGPTGLVKGFLRPETAQGIFVNFKRLLEFNQGKLPFGVAQIGNSFRNEISPRSGLIRVREFTMAEIEYFCDPNEKDHSKFDIIKDTEMTLYSACDQMDGKSASKLTIGEAVSTGLVANQTLGYFMVKIQKFLLMIGIKFDCLRFRQHMSNEMAHYACDCWDAECLTSYGWIECVGCADRSAYDLTQHSKATGIKLTAEKRLPSPKNVQVTELVINRQLVGKQFKKFAKSITEHLQGLSANDMHSIDDNLSEKGSYILKLDDNEYEITRDMVSLKTSEKTVHVEEVTPSVIEPSFGIGRIMYSILEHNFQVRKDDEQRCFFTLPATVAPLKCSVLPLMNNVEFESFIKKICELLVEVGISHKVDDSSGSIGRRYARTDEIAIPYGITIDFDTLNEPHTVTLRDRDSMEQIRIPLIETSEIVRSLTTGKKSWEDMLNKYPKFDAADKK